MKHWFGGLAEPFPSPKIILQFISKLFCSSSGRHPLGSSFTTSLPHLLQVLPLSEHLLEGAWRCWFGKWTGMDPSLVYFFPKMCTKNRALESAFEREEPIQDDKNCETNSPSLSIKGSFWRTKSCGASYWELEGCTEGFKLTSQIIFFGSITAHHWSK